MTCPLPFGLAFLAYPVPVAGTDGSAGDPEAEERPATRHGANAGPRIENPGRGEDEDSPVVRLVHAIAVGSTGRRRRLTPVGLLVFAASLAAVVVAGLATDRLLSVPALPGGPAWTLAGLTLVAAGLSLCGWCVGLFVTARGTPVPVNPPPELVQGGPYAWVRNPMLTGVFTSLFGTGLLVRSPSLVLLWVPAYMLLHVLELRWVEEPELERRFGVAYRAYRDATPMFLPLPRFAAIRRLRRFPPICVLAAAGSALAGRLRFQQQHVGEALVMEDGRTFRVFRHLALDRDVPGPERPALLVVRFRFARLSDRWNRRLSLLPVPVIGGYPGFRAKLWLVDDRGWWQGVYEWESGRAAQSYRGSLVFRTMERRAEPGTLACAVIDAHSLAEWMATGRASATAGRVGRLAGASAP